MAKKVGSGSLLEKRERKEWRRSVILFLCVVWITNVLTFNVARMYTMTREAELVSAREDTQPEITNYLIAGTLNQAEAAFEQFLPEFEGSIVYVNFKMNGWDPEVAATQIAQDIAERQTEARIWAISVGAQTAHCVDAKVDGVKIVAINPCTTGECLAPQFQGYSWLAVTLRALGYGFGWLSTWPVVPLSGVDTNTEAGRSGSSLILLLDQLVAVTCGVNQPGPYHAELVIVSRHDQLLDVEAEKALYVGSAKQILEIEADHAGTMVYADAYREAFRASGLTK